MEPSDIPGGRKTRNRVKINRHLPISPYLTASSESYFILTDSSGHLPVKLTTHVIPLGPPYDADPCGQPSFVPDKYWSQRYSLFSRYDEGILMDQESWYSVTHEAVAQVIAQTCAHLNYILDGFAGVGGNAIQFAERSHVVAIEIDKKKADYMRKNAKVYGVQQKIKVIRGDFFEKAEEVGPVDAVFLSPPWGGPDYQEAAVFSMLDMVNPPLGPTLELCAKLTRTVFLYMPRNIDPTELLELLNYLPNFPRRAEIQLYYFGNKVKTIGVIIGQAVQLDICKVAEAVMAQGIQSCVIDQLFEEFGSELLVETALINAMETSGIEECLSIRAS